MSGLERERGSGGERKGGGEGKGKGKGKGREGEGGYLRDGKNVGGLGNSVIKKIKSHFGECDNKKRRRRRVQEKKKRRRKHKSKKTFHHDMVSLIQRCSSHLSTTSPASLLGYSTYCWVVS